ncbi:MAG: hypothetical protein HUK26_06755 [Duodenibacillus sp.]|nr:hypothetical protein [Duodenibacillus sp.]
MKHRIAALCAGLLMTGAALAGQHAAALGECIYRNASAADRDALAQWAYVALGGTEAGRQVQAVPAGKAQQVSARARETAGRIVRESCGKESAAVLAKEPKTGARDAARALAGKLASERLEDDGLISLEAAKDSKGPKASKASKGSGGVLDTVGSGLSKAAGKVKGLFK